jgi:Xaa-Pro aminopeptidase
MKSDIDRLMDERGLDGFLVMGNAHGSVMRYLTGGAFMEGALLVKRKGQPLTLIHGGMERDTAAGTGLQTINRDEHFNRYDLLRKHEGDQLAAEADFLAQAMEKVDLRGRIGLYGMDEIGAALALVGKVTQIVEEIELVGEYGETLFNLARETKDNQELAELKRAGDLTCTVMGELQEFIQGHRVYEETVMRADGQPLTIGDVKGFISERLYFYHLKEDHGNIFAQGRDAGVPHNHGNLSMPLRLGQSIVFDFYPTVDSGYYHDITRTWSLGYATDEVVEAWEQTKEIFDRIMADLAVGRLARDYGLMTCEYYESKGHKTVRSHPGTQEGFVHSLGHGIGLDIHEDPRFTHLTSNNTILKPGHVITIEPGLYYPERGFGVRIEDSVAFNETGELIWLTDYPYDLVLPMKNA